MSKRIALSLFFVIAVCLAFILSRAVERDSSFAHPDDSNSTADKKGDYSAASVERKLADLERGNAWLKNEVEVGQKSDAIDMRGAINTPIWGPQSENSARQAHVAAIEEEIR